MLEVRKMTLEEATAAMLEALKGDYPVEVTINGETTIIDGKCKGNCDACRHCWRDDSVGDRECKKRDEMTEEQVDRYEGDMESGCPFYEEEDAEEIQAEEDYIASLMD